LTTTAFKRGKAAIFPLFFEKIDTLQKELEKE
jgi:hypothetical protein